MSVSGISSTALPQFGTPVIQPTRRQTEDQIGRELEQALQDGDLNGAEQAYQQLAAFGPNNSGPFSDPTMKSEFQALGQDLQNGNLSAAQSDNTALTTNLLRQDVASVVRASHSSNASSAQDQTALQTALANLKGDYWAVYGQQMNNSDALGMANGSGGSTTISVQV